MHALGRFLSNQKTAHVYALDMRDHGHSGIGGSIHYIGHLSPLMKIEIINGVNHTGLVVQNTALESIKIWMDYLVREADGQKT